MAKTVPKSLAIVRRRLAHRNGRQYYGRAYINGDKARITINPAKNVKARELMNTLVHEAVHLGDWISQDKVNRKKDLTEFEVETITKNVVNVLWREGYRKVQIR